MKFLLLLHENSWDRLPYLLNYFYYKESSIRHLIRQKIEERNLYEVLSFDKVVKIREALYNQTYRIPDDLKKAIEFDLNYVIRK